MLDELGECALEHGLELLIAQDRHFAWVGCGEFVVALPDDGAVFAGGVPGLGAVGCAAVSTVNLACEGAFTPAVASSSEFRLGEFPGFRVDDGWVGVGHVILGHFAFVGFALLGEEIYGETFL